MPHRVIKATAIKTLSVNIIALLLTWWQSHDIELWTSSEHCTHKCVCVYSNYETSKRSEFSKENKQRKMQKPWRLFSYRLFILTCYSPPHPKEEQDWLSFSNRNSRHVFFITALKHEPIFQSFCWSFLFRTGQINRALVACSMTVVVLVLRKALKLIDLVVILIMILSKSWLKTYNFHKWLSIWSPKILCTLPFGWIEVPFVTRALFQPIDHFCGHQWKKRLISICTF